MNYTRRNLHRNDLNKTLGNPISLHFSIITAVLALGLPQVADSSNPLTLGILARDVSTRSVKQYSTSMTLWFKASASSYTGLLEGW